MHDPRTLILRAMLLDGVGQLLILGWILWVLPFVGWQIGGSSLEGQGGWLLFSLFLYPFLGWLFGSYTVLRWRRLALLVLLQRLVITSTVSVMVVATTITLTVDVITSRCNRTSRARRRQRKTV